ncbi:hypothetical protein BASA60_011360 [Batrachochytrium salamandrivorans]|nr:hypothetical protein BASA60_011360 [Batrachochytrium salamandrivorans]
MRRQTMTWILSHVHQSLYPTLRENRSISSAQRDPEPSLGVGLDAFLDSSENGCSRRIVEAALGLQELTQVVALESVYILTWAASAACDACQVSDNGALLRRRKGWCGAVGHA